MIHFRKHIVQLFTALIVLLALLLPTAKSFAHSLEGHDHFDRCEQPLDIHVHEKKLDCDLYDVTFNNNAVFAFAKAVTNYSPVYSKKKYTYSNPLYIAIHTTRDYRGPPFC